MVISVREASHRQQEARAWPPETNAKSPALRAWPAHGGEYHHRAGDAITQQQQQPPWGSCLVTAHHLVVVCATPPEQALGLQFESTAPPTALPTGSRRLSAGCCLLLARAAAAMVAASLHTVGVCRQRTTGHWWRFERCIGCMLLEQSTSCGCYACRFLGLAWQQRVLPLQQRVAAWTGGSLPHGECIHWSRGSC